MVKKKALTLLEKQEQQEEDAKKKKNGPTMEERKERNRQITKQYHQDRLRAAFGASRDRMTKRKMWWEAAKDYVDEGVEVAPTRRKVSMTDANLGKLTKKQDPGMAEMLSKVLGNLPSR